MTSTLEEKINALIERAKRQDKVFRLGCEVYDYVAAKSQIMAYADSEIAMSGCSEDEYIADLEDCLEDNMYEVRCAESGDVIESFPSREEAEEYCRKAEEQDKADGTYEAGFYEIADYNGCARYNY